MLLVAIENLVAGLEKSPALLPPYTTASVRIRSNLDIKLGRVIGGWQWRAADRRCASRCGHSSKRASGLGVAFVGALCRRIDSQGVDPRSLNWKISSPGKARNRSPAPKPCTTPGRPPVSPAFVGCASAGRSRPTHGAPALSRGCGWFQRRNKCDLLASPNRLLPGTRAYPYLGQNPTSSLWMVGKAGTLPIH